MFANMLTYAAVICLTFSSMAQMSTVPHLTIVEEMRKELGNCSFPPREVLKHSSQGGLLSSCELPKPILIDEKPQTDDLKFFFLKYLCMELFDLSLQLCSRNISEEKFPTSEENLGKVSLSPSVTDFCEKLELPSSRAKNTSQWAGIAVDTLKNRTLCESHCISQNSLNPLCGAISWASKLLIAQSQIPSTVENTESQAVEHPIKGHESIEVERTETVNIRREEVAQPPNNSIVENRALESRVIEIPRAQNNEESSIGSDLNSGGQNLEKHSPVSSTQLAATATSTIAPIAAEVANRDMEKEDEHDEDLTIHSSRMDLNDPLVGEDKLPSDDIFGNVGAKGGSSDIFPQEAVVGEDAQSRVNSANGLTIDSRVYHDTFVDAQDSHFFAYFLTMVVICIVGYLVFHNKQKIIALALEGRRIQGSRRRPNTSNYKELGSNLEEAVTSSCSSSSVNRVIF